MIMIAAPTPPIIRPITAVKFKFIFSINTGKRPKITKNNKIIINEDMAQYIIFDNLFFLFSCSIFL